MTASAMTMEPIVGLNICAKASAERTGRFGEFRVGHDALDHRRRQDVDHGCAERAEHTRERYVALRVLDGGCVLRRGFETEEGPQRERDARTHALRQAQPCGFQAAANVSPLNQNQPKIDMNPTGRITPHTVTAPMRPVMLGAAEVRDRRQPQQRDHADARRDRRCGQPREERREIAERRDRDGDVGDRERNEIQEERLEVARFAVAVLGVCGEPPGRWL